MLKFLSVSIVILMLFSFAGKPGTMFPEAVDCAAFIAKDCLTENEKQVPFVAGTFNNCLILRPSERLAGEKDTSELTLTITQELLDTLPAETKFVAVCGYEGALAIAVAVMNAEQVLYEDGTECISIALRENDEKMLTDKRLVPMSRVSVTVKKDGKFAAADKDKLDAAVYVNPCGERDRNILIYVSWFWEEQYAFGQYIPYCGPGYYGILSPDEF